MFGIQESKDKKESCPEGFSHLQENSTKSPVNKKKTPIMTSATIKVLLSHLLRVSLDTGCRLQNHLFQGVQLLPFLLEMNITYWK